MGTLIPTILASYLIQGTTASKEYVAWYEANGHPALVTLYQIDEAGGRLFFSDRQNTDNVIIWSIEKKGTIGKLDWGNDGLSRCGISAGILASKEKSFVAATWGGFAIWALDTRRPEWHKMPANVNALSSSPDGDLFVTGIGPIITVWSVPTIVAETSARCRSDIFSLNYSSDSKRIVAGHEDGSLSLYDANTLTCEKRTGSLHRFSVLDAFFSAQNKSIVSVGYEGNVALTDLRSGKPSGLMSFKAGARCAAYARQRNWIVVGTPGGLLTVFDVGNVKVVFQADLKEAIKSVAISSNGSVLAAVSGRDYDDMERDAKYATMKVWKLKR